MDTNTKIKFEKVASQLNFDLTEVSATKKENPYRNSKTFIAYEFFCEGLKTKIKND